MPSVSIAELHGEPRWIVEGLSPAYLAGTSRPALFILSDLYGAEVIQNQLTPSRMTWKMNVLGHGVLNGGSVVRLVWLTHAISRGFARGS